MSSSEYLLCFLLILRSCFREYFGIKPIPTTSSVTLFGRSFPSCTGISVSSVFVGSGCQVSKRHCVVFCVIRLVYMEFYLKRETRLMMKCTNDLLCASNVLMYLLNSKICLILYGRLEKSWKNSQ